MTVLKISIDANEASICVLTWNKKITLGIHRGK